MDLNKWITTIKTNVSCSIWWYSELEKKYDKFGNYTHMGPAYRSADTDKLFFDIDCYHPDGTFDEESYRSMLTLWQWSEQHDYRREIAYTSGGYQMTVGVNVKPEYYESAVKNLAKDLSIKIDPNISLATLRRVVGSYNIGKESKSARNTFCISLSENEVTLPYHKHIELALNQRIGISRYGKNFYQPTTISYKAERKILDHRSDFNYDVSVNQILESYGYEYNDICKSIRDIIEQPRVGHFERFIIIKYLKDIVGIKYGDMIILLPKILTVPHDGGNDGSHSLSEGQVDSIYSHNLHFQPSKMINDGYCKDGCSECSNYLKSVFNANI